MAGRLRRRRSMPMRSSSKHNPKTTQAFVNAISAALAWLAKASTDEIVAAVPPEYYAGDRALYRAMIRRPG